MQVHCAALPKARKPKIEAATGSAGRQDAGAAAVHLYGYGRCAEAPSPIHLLAPGDYQNKVRQSRTAAARRAAARGRPGDAARHREAAPASSRTGSPIHPIRLPRG